MRGASGLNLGGTSFDSKIICLSPNPYALNPKP